MLQCCAVGLASSPHACHLVQGRRALGDAHVGHPNLTQHFQLILLLKKRGLGFRKFHATGFADEESEERDATLKIDAVAKWRRQLVNHRHFVGTGNFEEPATT